MPRLCLSLLAMLLAGALHAEPIGTENEVAVQGYNNEPISTYAEEADFRRLGRGVGLLQILTDVGPAPCTAFLVSDRHLLTNYHCVPGVLEEPRMNATRIESVTWLAGFTEPGRIEEAARFNVNPNPVEMSKPLDYAVLEVIGVPTDRFPPLPLAPKQLQAGLPYWILGHPLGKSQHISREGCRAGDPPMEGNRLRHTCDTLGGNSGSPIIDSSTRQVVGLHNSGNSRVGINFGIPMALILAESQVLRATAPTGPKPLPLVMTLLPQELGVGDTISVIADVSNDCTPTFVALSPTAQLTPIAVEFFEQVPLNALQTRYQILPHSRYGLQVQEQDEKGRHRLGFLCGPGDLAGLEALRDALRPVYAALTGGQRIGVVDSPVGKVRFAFQTFDVR